MSRDTWKPGEGKLMKPVKGRLTRKGQQRVLERVKWLLAAVTPLSLYSAGLCAALM